MDDLSQFILLLNQAVSPEATIRNQALRSLDQAFENIQAFSLLFQVIDHGQDVNQVLLACIFLQNWIKKHYKCLENLQTQDLLRVRSLQAYTEDKPAPAKSQITQAMVTMGTLDFPLNTYLLENVPRNSDVSYQLLKSIVKLKLCIYREKLEFIFKSINVRLNDYFVDLQIAVQSQQNVELALQALKMPLKLRVLESRVLTEYQTSILDYLKQLEFLQQLKKQSTNQQQLDIILQIIYYYQKCVLRAMSRQEKVDIEECSYVFLYLKTFYFDDHSLMANKNNHITSMSDLNKILQYSDDYRNYQEKILRITLQVVRLLNVVLDSYSYKPAYQMINLESLDLDVVYIQGTQILEMQFYEVYFEASLKYLFNYAMQLSLIQIYHIYHEPESSYTEEVEDSVAYDIRETGMEFLRTAFLDMKQDYIVQLIEQQIKIFQDQSLVEEPQMQERKELSFLTPPIDPGQMWACILQREAFYSIIARLFRLIRNEIDFEQWFIQRLTGELMEQNPLFLPLKLQILSMIYSYLDCSPEIPLDFCEKIAYVCLQLLHNTDLISIKLGCVRCLSSIVEQMSDEMKNLLILQKDTLKNLFMQCKQGTSKILLLEFFVQMLQFNAFDGVWVIGIILNEWKLCTQSALESTKYDGQNSLSLQGKILQVLCRAIRVTPWNVWFPTVPTLVDMIHGAIGSGSGLNEIFLVENGLSLFLHLLCRLSLKSSEEALQLFKGQVINRVGMLGVLDHITQLLGQIMIKNSGLWNHCVLGLGFLVVLGFGNDKLIGDCLIQATEEMYDEMKEEAFARLLFIAELYILNNSQSVYQVEKMISYLVNKMKIYHPLFQEHSVEQRELINVTHLLSVLAYTNHPLFWQIVQGTEWFSPLIQKTFAAHKLQIPLVQHKLCMFYLMCSKLLRNDAYVMSQLNVSRHEGIALTLMTMESFDFLQSYFLKRLDYVSNPIYVGFREIISQQEDEVSIRGLQPPNVSGMQGYVFSYDTIKQDFLAIKSLFQPCETLQRIEESLQM